MVKNLKTSPKKKVIFLLPTLNEEEAISGTIDKIPLEKVRSMGFECEIAIVDGGSKDRTVELARLKKVTIIQSPKKGYGFQYIYALSHISGDIVITGDADSTYPLEIAPKIIDLLIKENLDFINTNRFAGLKKSSMSLSHYIGNKILTLVGNLLFGLRLKDNQSGMWCFDINKIKKLGLENKDMAFSEEIKIRAFKKLKSKEIAITYRSRVGKSKLNYLHALKNLIFLFKLRLKI